MDTGYRQDLARLAATATSKTPEMGRNASAGHGGVVRYHFWGSVAMSMNLEILQFWEIWLGEDWQVKEKMGVFGGWSAIPAMAVTVRLGCLRQIRHRLCQVRRPCRRRR